MILIYYPLGFAMNFKLFHRFIIFSLLLMLTACSDSEKETKLVNLFTSASLDIIAIDFPAGTTEDIISTNTFFDYKIEGLKSNGIDTIAIDNNNIIWSLSTGATSTIDQNGRFSSGSVAENVTVTAQVGHLTQTQDIRVSAAKFDQVIALNSTPVLLNMCQAQQIKPVGRYINDDSTTEDRPVDNSIINTITWIILNQEDNSPSQRAFIKTENNLASLQAYETGDIIIQAKATSLYSGNVITSVNFNQTLEHNLNSLKLCLNSETDLATCSLSNNDIAQNAVVSLIAVANYQATDGTNFNQNISAYSKWGIDNNSNATIAFSTDRQQLDITGNIANTTANISVACGNIVETVPSIENGVILTTPVTCANGNPDCLPATAAMKIIDNPVTSLSVTANGINLVDNSAFILNARPTEIILNVIANFSDSSNQDITTDANINYNNLSTTIISEKANSPGQYTVLTSGDAEVQIIYQNKTFTAKITIPR